MTRRPVSATDKKDPSRIEPLRILANYKKYVLLGGMNAEMNNL
jgi:hypothetical protein